MNYVKYILFVVAGIFFAMPAYAGITQVEKTPDRLNAVQVFVLSEIYQEDVGDFFAKAYEKGVNTIIFRVFHNEGDRTHLNFDTDCSSGVYFKTGEACLVSDLLPVIIEAAHYYDMKVFAWMGTRSLSFLKTADNMSKAYSPRGGVESGYGANLFKPEVRDSLTQMFRDLAKYPIDGILFQDDFIIKHSEGADEEAVKLFEAETGITPSAELFFAGVKNVGGRPAFTGLKDEFYFWAEWKNNYLIRVFKHLKERVAEINPDIMFAVNVYYETPINPMQGLAWYSQKLESFEAAGADYYAVMGYSEQIGSELNLDNKSVAIYISKIAEKTLPIAINPERLIMKLQTKYFKNGRKDIPEADFRRVCDYMENMGGISLAFVPIFMGEDIRTCKF